MIPLALTTIRIERKAASSSPSTSSPSNRDPWDEGYLDAGGEGIEPEKWSVVARGVRAAISSPGGAENWVTGSTEEIVTWSLVADPCDLTYLDRVVDESTDQVFEVQYAIVRRGLGLDHVKAGVQTVRGAA